ncbi:ATP-binding protein [Streptomyces sp. NPDC048409]|uniref:sensor histidine kinase n=1 Tax=Streptomyces sp. NPDC048409 TaxID=3154723 RepID=UPI0034300AAC
MTEEALVCCLIALVVTAGGAAVLLGRRVRVRAAARTRMEADLTGRIAVADAQLVSLQEEMRRQTEDQELSVLLAEEAAEERTKAVLKASANFLQSLAAEQSTLLEEIQRKYGGHPVLSDLLEVSHANAQMVRKAQGIAVVCGAPPGRRGRPASVYDVVRNAQGQIRHFRRVQIMQQTGLVLKASAVSPVALAVAELLDNAASFSRQNAPIEVTFQRVRTNLCVVIDDAGVGMSDEERHRAAVLLSGEHVPRLGQFGGQPKFGFPVIGLLARQYGFRVDVSGVSRYGGLRAVVLVPETLWTEEEAPLAGQSPLGSAGGAHGGPEAVLRTAHGLPRRVARQRPAVGLAPQGGEAGGRAGAAAPEETARTDGRALGAFQRGTLSGRKLAVAPSERGDEA